MEAWRRAGLQPPVTCSFDSCSLSSVNRELVRKASQKDRLVVHSSMERDVGLLRLYPGIPASLVGKPEGLPPVVLSIAPMPPRALQGYRRLPLSQPFLGPWSTKRVSLPVCAPFFLSWAQLFLG